MPLITLLSDFGSMYPAQMKGVILRINPDVYLIDITHDIPPQDIQAGAFVLMIAAAYYPKGTVHVAVVDPGVGTLRRSILVESQRQMLELFNYGDILVAANVKMPLVRTFADVAHKELLMLIGSHGYLEMSVNSGSAVRCLRLQIEDEIQISKMNKRSR